MSNSFYKSAAVNFLKSLPGAAEEIYQKANLKGLREVVYYNQVTLANFSFVASQRHKDLKTEYNKVSSIENPSSDDIKKLKSLAEDLLFYTNSEFRMIAGQNFKYMQNFFKYKARQGQEVRVCIKIVDEQTNNVVTFARDTYDTYDYGTDCSIDKNTAFSEIYATGKYYLCNDIPKEAKKGSYKNTRIEESQITHYKEPGLFEKFGLWISREPHNEWVRCWKPMQTPHGRNALPPVKSCYKSTLVIPMSIANNINGTNLSSEFQQHFKLQNPLQRAILGFLCLDHVEKFFFEQSEDVDLGYIFSDIMSLYLIDTLTYTNYSRTYTESMKIINKSNSN